MLNNVGAPQAPNVTAFEVLHSMVHLALAPYFDAYTKGQNMLNGGKAGYDVDGKMGVPGTKKKIAELELSLLHLQQNIEIPELHLPLPDIILDAVNIAAARNIKPSVEMIPPPLLSDSRFLNDLQNTVNNWIKSIQTVTKMSRDPDSGSATQEINFWLSMESALEGIEGKLRSDGVQLTMDVLRNAKRFQATVSFSADTGLKDAVDTVQKYNQLMRDFPLDELLSATSLQKIQDSLDSIFLHLNKKLRICPYPIARALPLVSAISADLESQLHSLLHGRTLMHLDFRDFEAVMESTDSIWRTWDENVKDFTNVAREVTRRRNEKFIPIKIVPRHTKTQDRLNYVKTFRINHEQLQRTIVNVLGSKQRNNLLLDENNVDGTVIVEEIGDIDAVEEVAQAYATLKDVDVLDVSMEGTQIWVQAEVSYNERTARVENTIIARLRDRLATAKTANEMFRVFSKFNALFVRPKIRGAISEYQLQLIDNVKHDIATLHERFKQQYGNSEAHMMAQIRDIPSVSGAIIWARQIERQLDGYLRKVEDVLGRDWTLHTEGQKLQTEGANFRKKLDTRPIFESWLHEVTRRKVAIVGRLFGISRIRGLANILELSITFDPQIIALFKEVRNLLWLNYQVPHAINNVSKEAKRVYPYAVSLMESARNLAQINTSIEALSEVSILLAGYQRTVQDLIIKGIPLRWESFVHSYDLQLKNMQSLSNGSADRSSPYGRVESKHVEFVKDFSAAVSVLQDKTYALLSIHEKIQKAISELRICVYKAPAFRAHLESIQVAVDHLNLENYSNLGGWVQELNHTIEEIFLERLRNGMSIWVESFQSSKFDQTNHDSIQRSTPHTGEEDVNTPRFPSAIHEIIMQNQVIYLEPPTELARADWISHFHRWLGIICDLPRIESSRYEMKMTIDNPSESRFGYLPTHCAREICNVYSVIDNRISEMNAYIDKWLQFQSLWDLQSDHVYETLGENLSSWLQMLQEIRKTRTTFDTSESSRSFGNVIIEYDQVQAKVNSKYDQWQHEVVIKFASRLDFRVREVYAEVGKSRKDLEGQSLEASSTAQAVSLITVVQQCKRKVQVWEPEIHLFRKGQTTLVRHRYQLPSDWLHVEQIDHEWAALNEILNRKLKIVLDQTDALQAKIFAEDNIVNGKVDEAMEQWSREKPVSGTIAPDVASLTLTSFQTRLTKLRSESEMVYKAKEALDLPTSPDNKLASVLEEVQDFMSVWAALSTIWKSLNDLRDMLWSSVQPRKLKQSLESLIKMTKEMPSRMRQYAAFEHIQGILRQLLKANPIVSELKSEAVRERHWIKIFKSLKPGKRHSQLSMTLGDVWDLQLIASEPTLRDIIAQAQGEMALEEFVKQVRDTWHNYALDLVNYQNKCRLIRGWDDLFAKCGDNLNSLQAMRHSPYYKEFEEEASSWEDKLNRVHVLFDVWIDVQRQWVYLEGVFTGNADIKHLLPMESSRFQNINTEFFTIMKKVNKSPYVLDVLNIGGVQKTLERLAELLNKIQKALGEYLEKERVSFPRFYFVGDEDLLEMIGNSNDTMRIAKHFRKMFAGLSGLLMAQEATITGFTSKEGEAVQLKKKVSLIKIPKINDWLAALETNMKITLAELLAEAVEKYRTIFSPADLDSGSLHQYINAFPAQVVVLATQVVWTGAVDGALASQGEDLQYLYDTEVKLLEVLASMVLGNLEAFMRKKCEHLITEFVHQRDTIGKLLEARASSPNHYLWLIHMRYQYKAEGDFIHRLRVKMANADLEYGFEYLGVPERLVRTPLTDRCFLTLTQAMAQRLGGSPYGPAGTGKTALS